MLKTDPATIPVSAALDLGNQVRSDFPILQTHMNGHELVYLDNGASTQKPRAVIDAIAHYYLNDHANIHRGLYELSQRATEAYERARDIVAGFLSARESCECIFTRGTTEAINLVATSWGHKNLEAGDEVIITVAEHHSNIVPWQMVCEQTGAKLRFWDTDQDGVLDRNQLESLLNKRTKMLAFQHVSNALGTIHNAREFIRIAKSAGATVLVDGAQWVGHSPTNVQDLGCDFYAFSGHKAFGPTGIGVLWGRAELLRDLPPYQGGGDMIETVSVRGTTYADLPSRFEAGTPNISGAIGLGAAIEYLQSVGLQSIHDYERQLLAHANRQLKKIPGLRILGDVDDKVAVVSFVLEDPFVAPIDVATHLSESGIAIRTGHHCCMPLMEHLGVKGTCRASMAFYNTFEDVDRLAASLSTLVESRTGDHRGEASSDVSSGHDENSIPFAVATAPTVADAADELAEEFLDFDDRESKTELLMELGQSVPAAFEALKAISAAVPGCMSEVYLVGRPMPDSAGRIEISADSNAEIVRGLIAVLQHLFSGQNAAEVVAFDIEAFFKRIGLNQFISTQRRSGLNGMVDRIRTLAQSIAQA